MVQGVTMPIVLSAHFTAREFESRGRALSGPSLARYTRLAVDTLEPLRAALGVPMLINCGERLPDHNADVGGEESSYHLPPEHRADPKHRTEACACDFHCPALTPKRVAEVADKLMRTGMIPAGGIGTYRTFVHIDNRGYVARWTGK